MHLPVCHAARQHKAQVGAPVLPERVGEVSDGLLPAQVAFDMCHYVADLGFRLVGLHSLVAGPQRFLGLTVPAMYPPSASPPSKSGAV